MTTGAITTLRSVAPLPVTLLIGLSATALTRYGQALMAAQSRMARVAWVEQDNAGTDFTNEAGFKNVVPSVNTVAAMRLGAGCLCCVGQAVFQAALPRLLRQGPWDHLVLALAPSSHPAKVLDLLRAPTWSAQLNVVQVLLVVNAAQRAVYTDAVGESPNLAAVIALLARAQLQVADRIVLMHHANNDEQPIDLSAFRSSIATYLLDDVDVIEIAATTSASTGVELRDVSLKSSSWQQHELAGNQLVVSAKWPATIVFDRRPLLSLLDTWCQDADPQFCDAIFATARAWYRWSICERRGHWQLTDHRRFSYLTIRMPNTVQAQHSLQQLSQRLRQVVISGTGCIATGL